MRSAAMPSRQISSTGKIAKDKNKFKVCVKMGYIDVGDGCWRPNSFVGTLRCSRPNQDVGDRFNKFRKSHNEKSRQHNDSATNVSNQS